MKVSDLFTPIRILILSVGIVLATVVFFTKEVPLQNFSGDIMGTSYNISIAGNSNINNSLIFKKLDLINEEMSTYIPTSFINKFNETPVDVWIEASPSFLSVLSYAIEVCKFSNGYFDVTAGILVNLWGFGPNTVDGPPPSTQIKQSLEEIGCSSISINNLNGKIRRNKDVRLDFSAIAKGFAIDQLYDTFLLDDQVTGFLIEIGGEIKTYGYKNKKEPWVVGISHPTLSGQSILKIKTDIKETFSMATSGDYRNFKLLDDKMLSHTINTNNGMPIEVRGLSVTVISDSAMKADALATALNAMGPDEGLKFSNLHGIDSIFVFKERNQYVVKRSENLQNTLQ